MTLRTATLGWIGLIVILAGCSKKEETQAKIPFSDNFDRTELGENYSGDPGWRIKDGQVFSAGTSNRAVWLKASLPDNAVIEFDTRSESPAGDIKFEIYADGKNHESGYILIFGGWNNTISCIARKDEHGADRQELKERGLVKIGQTHRVKVIRQDKVIKWYIDGKLILDYFDSEPLRGPGNDRLGFNNWQSHVYFDNLSIREAGDSDK
ncbi:MAG: hypothetical protein JRJ87_05445 [Deltaproteobacteria bacterium]|nr:hypothetical protein [Deltaproteobacteria bacterium]